MSPFAVLQSLDQACIDVCDDTDDNFTVLAQSTKRIVEDCKEPLRLGRIVSVGAELIEPFSVLFDAPLACRYMGVGFC